MLLPCPYFTLFSLDLKKFKLHHTNQVNKPSCVFSFLIKTNFFKLKRPRSLSKNGFICKTQQSDKLGFKCIERNVINNLSLNSEMVSPMPITRLMLLEIIIAKLWNIIPHWTSRFEIYPKE
jgi:hypothetical protein